MKALSDDGAFLLPNFIKEIKAESLKIYNLKVAEVTVSRVLRRFCFLYGPSNPYDIKTVESIADSGQKTAGVVHI